MSSAIHFLDASDCFYVLQREPMGLAVEFLVKTGRPFELPIVGLEEGAENDWFLSNFEVDADGGSRDGGLNIVVAGA
ncbi:hypothetical protein BC829DRAFT_402490 [Chytridium lagenaria]|nr:hypothetical protein BC829DRAFT_402490 [Chytridium lagenaria]